MCFSATACFTAGAILVPAGLYSLNKAYQGDRRFLGFAAFPLFFGLQQIIEGGLWLALEGWADISVATAALGFLFFAYFLWPFYVPLAALLVENNASRRRIFLAFCVIGFVFGTSLYLPLLLTESWISVQMAGGSILYQPKLIYDDFVSRTAVRVFYAIIVAIPLLFSSVKTVRYFGVLIFLSVVFSAVYFAYAFVSIWCFFAAILSAYVLYVIHRESYPPLRAHNTC